MGRAYVGLYDVSEGDLIAPVMPDAWVEPGSFELPGREPFAAIGSGWLAHPHLLERHRGRIAHVDPDLLPSSRDLMDFALREFDAGNVVAAEAALPEYLGQQPALPGVQSSRQEN
jgi:tRNA A37 threonylcarbamoyladenosine modification protein TsaB